MALLGLPGIPHELRAVQPYLQRAEELKSKDPVMSYWCAYHAAQIGISLKAKGPGSRELLFGLLAKLEQMKQEIGPTDAIDQEIASSAYVENFALKVFAMADNEDRKGQSSRSTAKKFLAAANFLEVLKVFSNSNVSESNDEKIRYAKWKAADIAKAFREGRKPVPGPAGSQLTSEATPDSFPDMSLPSVPDSVASGSSATSSASSSTLAGGDSPPSMSKSSRHRRRSSASPPKLHGDIALNPELPSTPPRKPKPPVDISDSLTTTGAWGVDRDPTSPGTWSTAATPGTANPTPSAQFGKYAPVDQNSPSDNAKRKGEERQDRQSGSDHGSEGSDTSGGSLKSSLKYQSNGNANAEALGLNNGSKSVRWTPSVEGGLSSAGGSAPVSPEYESFPSDPASFMNLPPGFIPHGQAPPFQNFTVPPGAAPQIYVNNNSPPQAPSAPPQIYANSPPQQPPQIYAPNPNVTPHPSAPPSLPQIYANTPSPPQTHPTVQPVPTIPAQVELTPNVIAKAQRHCRFAISSLDYEDAEQARRELRAALAVLGG